MSMTFTKLFSSITESTIWGEPDHVRILWITMLAMADRHGRVWASVPGLANRARITTEQCEDGLSKFSSPDKYSRTPDNEGRRIEQIDGGWRLLNHDKYRQIRDSEAIKESKRMYARRVRDVEKVELRRTPSNPVDRGRHNAEAEAEAEADQIHTLSGKPDGVGRLKPRGLHPDTELALEYLNLVSKRAFRKVPPNLSIISARLSEAGVTLEGVKAMIDRQVTRWSGTTQAEYLRPETLFGRTKFDSYYASKDEPVLFNNDKGKPQMSAIDRIMQGVQ